MTLYDYIASKNPLGANELLVNYGFKETSNSLTIANRLKSVVRKYKKIALQEISLIHPDKALLDAFTTSTMDDSDFAYASGVRTPEFLDEPQEEEPKETGFLNTPPPLSAFVPPLPITPQIPDKVIQVIKELKNQVRTDRRERNKEERRRDLERLNLGNVNVNTAGFNQTSLLMCAVAFAVGYMIAKKSK